MNINTKKRIAKEIIYFFAVIILLIIFWSFLEIRNHYFQNNAKNYNAQLSELKNQINEIENLNEFSIIPTKRIQFIKNIKELRQNNASEDEIKSMTKDFKDKFSIESILQEYVATANNPEYKSDFKVINSKFPELNHIDKSVLEEYVATANNPKYKSDFKIINSKFPEFFSEQNEVIKKIKKLKHNEEIANHELNESELKILSIDNKKYNIKILSIILFGFLYPIRIIYILLKWSINILKLKN